MTVKDLHYFGSYGHSHKTRLFVRLHLHSMKNMLDQMTPFFQKKQRLSVFSEEGALIFCRKKSSMIKNILVLEIFVNTALCNWYSTLLIVCVAIIYARWTAFWYLLSVIVYPSVCFADTVSPWTSESWIVSTMFFIHISRRVSLVTHAFRKNELITFCRV